MSKLRFKLIETDLSEDIDTIETFYADPVKVYIRYELEEPEDIRYKVIVYIAGRSVPYHSGATEDEARNYAEEVIDKLAGREYETYEDVQNILKETEDPELEEEIELEEVPTQVDFLESSELEELREILLNIPEDIELLLLDDVVIVLGTVEDQNTYLYTLPEDEKELVLLELPLELDRIMNNDNIIKYKPEEPDSRHSEIVNLLSKKEERITEEVEEVNEDEED